MEYEYPRWIDVIYEALEEAKSKPKIKEEAVVKEKIVLSAKEDGLLWFEMLKVLSTIKAKNGIVSFPNYFEKACTKFSITKAKAWNCMFFLAEFGLIEVVKGHGIKLNYSIK